MSLTVNVTGSAIDGSPASLLDRQSRPLGEAGPVIPAAENDSVTGELELRGVVPEVELSESHGRSLGEAQSDAASVSVHVRSVSTASTAWLPIVSGAVVPAPSFAVAPTTRGNGATYGHENSRSPAMIGSGATSAASRIVGISPRSGCAMRTMWPVGRVSCAIPWRARRAPTVPTAIAPEYCVSVRK